MLSYMGPVLGEPLPLELANTRYLVRGRHRDGLETAEHLVAWLMGIRSSLETTLTDTDLLAVDDVDLARVRQLRDCIHILADAIIDGSDPDAAVLDRLNRHARAAPHWKELRWDDHPYAEIRSGAPPVGAAIGEIAHATIELVTGDSRTTIKRCPAPGCILYFLKNHPRREWCSNTCGNRVRAARHYELAKKSRA